MFEHIFVIALSLVMVKVIAIWSIFRRASFWKTQGKLLSERSGHLTPYQPAIARLALGIVASVGFRLKIGKLKVYGRENTRAKGYRFIFAPNHQNELDSVLMAYLLRKRKYRFMIAMDQVQGARAPWMAFIGGISVVREKPRLAVDALNSAAEALGRERGSDFLIFPQGKLVETNQLRQEDFHTGPVHLGRKAAAIAQENFALLPVLISYITDPREAGWLARLLKFFRYDRSFYGTTVYGARVHFGKPMPLEDLPHDKKEATTALLEALLAMQRELESTNS